MPKESAVAEVAPPGWEKTVKAMKKHDEIDNPYALAWSMKNKGYKSHKKESIKEGGVKEILMDLRTMSDEEFQSTYKMSKMQARGLGASSMAGQAIVQAAMESALPIAQADAQIQAQFEGQNLSNRQQIAMLSAQQRAKFMGQEFDQAFQSRVQNSARIGDIANMNFTAEQQVQLENSCLLYTSDAADE